MKISEDLPSGSHQDMRADSVCVSVCVCVNNLPKVVTRQWVGQESNSRPLESYAKPFAELKFGLRPNLSKK